MLSSACRSLSCAASAVSRRVIGARCLSSSHVEADVEVIDHSELIAGPPSASVMERIEKAYGKDGLGIVAVTGVPQYQEFRSQLLPLAQKLAALPQEDLAAIEHPASSYSVGWSHGKESFDGKPDTAKGSFYANPQHDRIDLAEISDPAERERLRKEHPSFLTPNLWPGESLPELRDAFRQLGGLLVSEGALVARACDAFVEAAGVGEFQSLEEVVSKSRITVGRLLWYFPLSEAEARAAAEKASFEGAVEGSWCGWHNDHGSLTGLCSAMFLDEAGQEVTIRDPNAGLFARSRDGTVSRVNLPPNAMAFQIGETAQVHSGGVLQATPHAVRAASAASVGRAQLAVFMEPEWDGALKQPSGIEAEAVLRDAAGRVLPDGVPSLRGRWEPSDDFGTFSAKTLKQYYG